MGERPAKYGNRRTHCGAHWHASRKEGVRCWELRQLEAQGLIHDLEQQPEYALEVNGVLICKYRGDFRYVRDERWVLEDTKSEVTRRIPLYRVKKKLMLAIHGLEIRES